MPKYLITGAKGTLGAEFVRMLPAEEVLAADRDLLDITDQDQVFEFILKNKPQVVINCAAFTDVDAAEENFDVALNINGASLRNLSLACNEDGVTLVHFSSGMVFDGKNPNGYLEQSPPNPVNKYGQSKLAGEKNILEICQKYYIIRSEWIYGMPQTKSAKKSFVELMIELGKSGRVKGVTDEIGKPTWTKDLAKATVSLINSEHPTGIYHITNEGQASRLQWAREIFEILGMTVEIAPVSGLEFPRPAPRGHYELLINTKILPILRPWQEALSEYLKPTQS